MPMPPEIIREYGYYSQHEEPKPPEPKPGHEPAKVPEPEDEPQKQEEPEEDPAQYKLGAFAGPSRHTAILVKLP